MSPVLRGEAYPLQLQQPWGGVRSLDPNLGRAAGGGSKVPWSTPCPADIGCCCADGCPPSKLLLRHSKGGFPLVCVGPAGVAGGEPPTAHGTTPAEKMVPPGAAKKATAPAAVAAAGSGTV